MVTFYVVEDLRKGDPLSPMFFCLALDVFTKSTVNLVDEGHLKPMTRHIAIPTHVVYADDILVFYKGIIEDNR